MHTQEIKAAFPGEGGVIHEVDEESQVDQNSDTEGLRHSILKGDRSKVSVKVSINSDEKNLTMQRDRKNETHNVAEGESQDHDITRIQETELQMKSARKTAQAQETQHAIQNT